MTTSLVHTCDFCETEEFTITPIGTINEPGKFEGEMVYVPHYWNVYLHGFASRDDGTTLGFDIDPKDRLYFRGWIPVNKRTVRLIEDDQGFVHEV